MEDTSRHPFTTKEVTDILDGSVDDARVATVIRMIETNEEAAAQLLAACHIFGTQEETPERILDALDASQEKE